MTPYILVNRVPVLVDDINKAKQAVVKKDTIDGIFISTIFLAWDHSWEDGGTPILFETMIFGGKHDQYQERYSTWVEARKGHKRAVNLVKKSLCQEDQK